LLVANHFIINSIGVYQEAHKESLHSAILWIFYNLQWNNIQLIGVN